VLYTYVGYAFLAWLWVKVKGKRESSVTMDGEFPTLALIVPAYNEAGILDEKIKNSLALDYPADRWKLVVVTDGSSDQSSQVAASYSGIVHMHQPERKGKVAAINRVVALLEKVDILVFCDANTMLNTEALRCLVAHYADPRVGGVSGEKKVLPGKGREVAEEGVYWKYESALKKLDSRIYSIVGAAGELFSMRRDLYVPIPEDTILDDFIISMQICEKGYVVRYEPRAIAAETPSLTIEDEKIRKVRISAGAFQSLNRIGYMANPFKYGILGFQFLSRRVMRWVFCPIALPLLLILNGWLYYRSATPEWLYRTLLLLQVAFYAMALIGAFTQKRKWVFLKFFALPYYFLFMNFSVWQGFFRFINGRQSALWQKAKR
jgi:cellulose synthase/poly-beta-1,6-N-acetylglucosamine synthase-like glycosyltransferase